MRSRAFASPRAAPAGRNTERSGREGGFTLLETMVALILIVAALAGPFTLATRGIFSAKFSKNKLTALNLAQEGLELIRSFRDNNILITQPWDLGIGGPLGSVTDWQADIWCTGLPCTTARSKHYAQCSGACPPLSYDSITASYSYEPGGTPSLFTRTITIDRSHYDLAVPHGDQMKAISRVTWTESGTPRAAQLEVMLYNWQ